MATRIEFQKHGGPDVLQAVEFTPTAPGENEIQVENKAIGINYIDTYIRGGLYPPPSMPSGLGTEAAGIVSKVGSAVKHIKEGDRVVYAQSALGAYSSIHNVPAEKAALLPNAIGFEQAAASFLKGLTVYYLLRKTYEIKPDEQFLFHAAAGGVGLIACQWAKALGAKLIGTTGSAQKAQRALDAGADDYITKPYNPMELVARVKAMLRRYLALGTLAGAPARENVVTLGGLSLDLDEKQLTVDGAPVRLTATEYRIVALLMQNPGRVYNAEEIYERVWNEPGFSVENTVMVHIRRIREKIEINPKNPKYLKVVWGLGYKMEKAQ